MRPGITDFATIHYYKEDEFLDGINGNLNYYNNTIQPKKMKMSLQYVDNHNVGLDIKILFLTVWKLSFGRLISKINRGSSDIER